MISSTGAAALLSILQAVGTVVQLGITLLQFVATFALLAVTFWYARTTRETLQHFRDEASAQMLYTLLKDYHSPEMHLALAILWAFRRECGDEHDFVSKYMDRYRIESERLRGRPDEFRGTEVIANSVDYQRRLVSGFYARMDALVKSQRISEDDARRYWDDDARAVLQQIVKPVEEEFARRREAARRPPTPTSA